MSERLIKKGGINFFYPGTIKIFMKIGETCRKAKAFFFANAANPSNSEPEPPRRQRNVKEMSLKQREIMHQLNFDEVNEEFLRSRIKTKVIEAHKTVFGESIEQFQPVLDVVVDPINKVIKTAVQCGVCAIEIALYLRIKKDDEGIPKIFGVDSSYLKRHLNTHFDESQYGTSTTLVSSNDGEEEEIPGVQQERQTDPGPYKDPAVVDSIQYHNRPTERNEDVPEIQPEPFRKVHLGPSIRMPRPIKPQPQCSYDDILISESRPETMRKIHATDPGPSKKIIVPIRPAPQLNKNPFTTSDADVLNEIVIGTKPTTISFRDSTNSESLFSDNETEENQLELSMTELPNDENERIRKPNEAEFYDFDVPFDIPAPRTYQEFLRNQKKCSDDESTPLKTQSAKKGIRRSERLSQKRK